MRNCLSGEVFNIKQKESSPKTREVLLNNIDQSADDENFKYQKMQCM